MKLVHYFLSSIIYGSCSKYEQIWFNIRMSNLISLILSLSLSLNPLSVKGIIPSTSTLAGQGISYYYDFALSSKELHTRVE